MNPEHAHLHRPVDAARRLGIGRTKIFELMSSGELRSVKVGRARLVPERAIIEFVERIESEQCPSGAA